jgi:hypothetical protein
MAEPGCLLLRSECGEYFGGSGFDSPGGKP